VGLPVLPAVARDDVGEPAGEVRATAFLTPLPEYMERGQEGHTPAWRILARQKWTGLHWFADGTGMNRILHPLLWCAVMALITVCAGAALVLGYSGIGRLVAGRPVEAAGSAGLATLLGIACYAICRNIDDLMDRRS
jgi:hypothetical protein